MKPPALSRLAREGAVTRDEVPIFPSLTFPNHIAQATGATVDGHGIPMNGFFDTATSKLFNFPDDQSLLRAEPIWVTAKRQGVGVCVDDWPMSQRQAGQWLSDFHPAHFDPNRSDAERFREVLDVIGKAQNPRNLRLIMTYASHVDTVGHRKGPDSPEIADAVNEVDGEIGTLVAGVTKWFGRDAEPG